ncbi:MAG: HK97 gp10 family phage protein [Bacilli bacterium]
MAIKIDALSQELTKAMAAYTKDIAEGMRKATNKVTTEAVKELHSLDDPKITGDYLKGWAKKKTIDGYTIHNKKKPGLTHLLEKGHAKRGGGRVNGIVHIRPVEERANKSFEDEVMKVIRE